MNYSEKTKSEAFKLLASVLGFSKEDLVEVFDHSESYTLRRIEKKTGGFRNTYEPDEPLKKAQYRILYFLKKLERRKKHYKTSYKKERDVAYQDALKHTIEAQAFGSLKKGPMSKAVSVHTELDANFLLKLDLKDAYPSVTKERLEEILLKIFLDDCHSYYYAYKNEIFRKRRYALQEELLAGQGRPPQEDDYVDSNLRWGHPDLEKQMEEYQKAKEVYIHGANLFLRLHFFDDVATVETWRYSKFGNEIDLFPKHTYLQSPHVHFPLFPSNSCPAIRGHIRRSVKNKEYFVTENFLNLMRCFTKYLVELITYRGKTPQGAPTSSLLLHLALSELGIIWRINQLCKMFKDKKFTLYVDDFIISSIGKPSLEFVRACIAILESTNDFRVHPDKIKLYDLRMISGPALGMRLVRHLATKDELDTLVRRERAGALKAVRKDRRWYKIFLTLSKNVQNKYRAALYQIVEKDNPTDTEIDRANGYHGHIVSIYGREIKDLPAKLKSPVAEFRARFHKKTSLGHPKF
jgi:hypothetical protein